jgi:hypothetical protein
MELQRPSCANRMCEFTYLLSSATSRESQFPDLNGRAGSGSPQSNRTRPFPVRQAFCLIATEIIQSKASNKHESSDCSNEVHLFLISTYATSTLSILRVVTMDVSRRALIATTVQNIGNNATISS